MLKITKYVLKLHVCLGHIRFHGPWSEQSFFDVTMT